MKKYIAIVLVAAMALGLTACGGSTGTESTVNETVEVVEVDTEEVTETEAETETETEAETEEETDAEVSEDETVEAEFDATVAEAKVLTFVGEGYEVVSTEEVEGTEVLTFKVGVSAIVDEDVAVEDEDAAAEDKDADTDTEEAPVADITYYYVTAESVVTEEEWLAENGDESTSEDDVTVDEEATEAEESVAE